MIETNIPIVGFAAFSGTGKTTLLTKLISIFRERGLRVGVIKHAHHSFDLDQPGKDSYEIRKAGANQILVGSSKRWALLAELDEEEEKPLAYHVNHLDLNCLDLILVEGFKHEPIPKIELYRKDLNTPMLFPDDHFIIAIATDVKDAVSTDLPKLDINDPGEIADFITDRFMNEHLTPKQKSKNA